MTTKKDEIRKKFRKPLILKKEQSSVCSGSDACGWCTCCGQLVRCGY